MKFFFSCDWGTSTFRLRLVDAENESVLSEIITGNGIASTFESWKETGNNEKNKLAFYQSYLLEQVKNITPVFNHSFHNTPIIISGMASSNIGMVALPYKPIPYYCNGYDLVIQTIDEAEEIDQHKIVLISGVRSASDVMRGEETILAGCNVSSQAGEQLFILPGTHSKHIVVKDGKVTGFKTYMTGEFFELLNKKSLLAGSVNESQDFQHTKNQESFQRGIQESELNLLHTAFFVRTNDLFQKLTKEENYFYLSGLLIGTELREIKPVAYSKISLVVNEGMKSFYVAALKSLGIEDGSAGFETINADQALVAGQLVILNQMQKVDNKN
jgi:2-dehydro-3-deoxygalactonokinase